MRVVFYFEYKMVTAYYIRFECPVKDFIINIYLCYLRALNLIQAKKGEVSCNVSKICIFCIVVYLKLKRDIQ